MTSRTSDSDDGPISESATQLQGLIESREATVGVVGLGYVGLPLAGAMHGSGLKVLGYDVDESKIVALSEGRNYLQHLGDDLTESLSTSERFSATTDFSRLRESDVLFVCVPTPLGRHREPDLGYVLETAKAIGRVLRPGQLLVLESTTYPGTTRDEFLPGVLAGASESGIELQPGIDFFVAYSPEREDPGRKSHSTTTIPKVVGGLDSDSGRLAALVYGVCIEDVRTVSSAEVAEASKLLENIFRAVNIAMVNEMKILLEEMKINVWEVIEAARTKPFGFMPFYPGPGLGGHCIPIDPFYLTWKAKEIGRPTRFIELAGEVNTEMPNYVISRLVEAMNDVGKPVRSARVLVMGLAYKADVDDTRESPSFELIEKLRAMGADVDYSDPHIPRTVPVRKHDLQMESVDLSPESVRSYDVVLVATAHAAFDLQCIAEHAALVVDTRNAMAEHAVAMGTRLVRA